jgi:hypothetical protein
VEKESNMLWTIIVIVVVVLLVLFLMGRLRGR